MPLQKSHLHETLFKYFHNKELDELYLSVFLKSLAESLINIFVPIYLLQLGYSLFDIAFYYLIYYLAVALFMPLGMAFNSTLGIKKTMALGTTILLSGYYLLNSLNNNYYWAALVLGISISIYYSAFHVEFTKSADKKEEGEELSILKVLAMLAAVLGPFAGSLFITELSFSFLFLIVGILLFLSILPLFFSKDFKTKPTRLSFKDVSKVDTKSKAISYQANGIISMVTSIFWPIFIYTTLGTVTYLGGIISGTSVLMIFIVLFIGRLVDKNNRLAIWLGTFSHAPTWILRIFLLNPAGIFISNLLNSITLSLMEISFGKIVYQQAEKTKDLAAYFVFRSFNLNLGRILLLIAAMFFQNLTWLFIVAFFASFVHLNSLKELKK